MTRKAESRCISVDSDVLLRTTVRRGGDDIPESAVKVQLGNLERDGEGVRARPRFDNHFAILREFWDHDPDPAAEKLQAMPIQVIAVDGAGEAKRSRAETYALRSAARVNWVDGDQEVHAQQPEYSAGVLGPLAQKAGR